MKVIYYVRMFRDTRDLNARHFVHDFVMI